MSSLLVRLGLSRAGPWEPPSVLDRLLASPVRAVAYFLWRAMTAMQSWMRTRTRTRKTETNSSSTSAPLRVVCIADTHDLFPAHVPPGDLLIHAGDLTNSGSPADLQLMLDWLTAQPHRHKVVVAGNHDAWMDPVARVAAGLTSPLPPDPVFATNVHYLQHRSVVLDFAAGRRLTVFGAPDIPVCGPASFAFQYDPDTPPWKDAIPADIDILVTHAPPRHHCDLELGCPGLLRELWRVRPALHVFGHVHWGAGREVLHWDASQQAYESLMGEASPSSWLACLRLLLSGVLSSAAALAWPSMTIDCPTTVLINAAQMYGDTGRLRNDVQVIDL
ncbi:phosphoric ester hydrolase [Grosmannia clavigera kw1407]|uniref:Phosphoric ester hydrolase n=1 Tax=Grosmannia clavigera (strain kw1407 / UAMH 11150) TaxID=655863 RepID=F0XFJ9_GROCL|nr:phosphoric ester hydrolase [Grosmannia clavigera kw1407]EFX04273.1 phosphoric ester hydrolase [Grosmannia clavigera kw1407]